MKQDSAKILLRRQEITGLLADSSLDVSLTPRFIERALGQADPATVSTVCFASTNGSHGGERFVLS